MRNEILEAIEFNPKRTVSDLSVILDFPEEQIEKEIKKMEKDGIICGYHTLINWDKTSVDKVTAIIEVKVTPQRERGFDKIAERIYNYEEVSSVYLMSGGYDFSVMIDGVTMKEVALFVANRLAPIEGVISTATHFILKKYKDHGIAFEYKKTDGRMVVS